LNKANLEKIILDQKIELEHELNKQDVILREGIDTCKQYIKHPNILLVTGLRRAGKSFFANLLVQKKKYAFLKFDDERLIEFKSTDFNLVLECFKGLYKDFEYIVFDEIQNIEGWDLFISRLRSRYKIIVTGSNANLLSNELSTYLTGRFMDYMIFPLSFSEFLSYNKISFDEISLNTTAMRSTVSTEFSKYVANSGIFEYYQAGKSFLRNLWSSVITRDVILRYNVKYPVKMEELAILVLNSFSSKISMSNLSKHLKIKSHHTVIDYISCLEKTFLIFTVSKFSYKLREQMSASKKIYIIDNGFIVALGFNFSENRGKLLENIVAIELKRRSHREDYSLFYWDNYYVECDFIIKKGLKIVAAYQVCSELNLNNKKRELDGLTGAMKEFDLKQGVILTESTEEEIIVNGFKINIIPVWKWLLVNI
jgi:hypothetical protein